MGQGTYIYIKEKKNTRGMRRRGGKVTNINVAAHNSPVFIKQHSWSAFLSPFNRFYAFFFYVTSRNVQFCMSNIRIIIFAKTYLHSKLWVVKLWTHYSWLAMWTWANYDKNCGKNYGLSITHFVFIFYFFLSYTINMVGNNDPLVLL